MKRFLAGGKERMRPSAVPGAFDTQQELLSDLREAAAHQRVYISPELRLLPGLALKQGMMRELHVVEDYSPVSLKRYASYFERVSSVPTERQGFRGFYTLDATTHWKLMDLTSTRFYVARRGDALDRTLAQAARHPKSSGFRFVRPVGAVRGVSLSPVADKRVVGNARVDRQRIEGEE